MALHLIISYAFIGIKVSQRFRKFGGVGNGRGRSFWSEIGAGVIQNEFLLFRVIILSDYSLRSLLLY